jgi:hypothetical protein
VDIRTGLDPEATGKVLSLCRGSYPGHPACSQTLKIVILTSVVCRCETPLYVTEECGLEFFHNEVLKKILDARRMTRLM